jgi:uncharacterized membrane protein
MTTDESDDFDPEARDQREIGREMVDQSTGLGSVMAHFYRGEMDRETTWRQRLDQTTTWAVTVIAAILTYAFSSSGTSHAILLSGMVITTLFLGIEARRYQDYDIYRARIRMIQENLFANALDPSAGVEHQDWRRELSNDLRNPSVKIPYREAVHRRLRRVYLALLVLLLAAWVFRITVLSSKPWLDSAAFGPIPGSIIIGIVVLFYLTAFSVTNWPLERQAKGEFDDREEGIWKDNK